MCLEVRGNSAGSDVCVLSSLPHRSRRELCDGRIRHWGVGRPGIEAFNCRFGFSILTTLANWRSGSASSEAMLEGDCSCCSGELCVDLGGETVRRNGGCNGGAEEVRVERRELEDSPLLSEPGAVLCPALEHVDDDWGAAALRRRGGGGCCGRGIGHEGETDERQTFCVLSPTYTPSFWTRNLVFKGSFPFWRCFPPKMRRFPAPLYFIRKFPFWAYLDVFFCCAWCRMNDTGKDRAIERPVFPTRVVIDPMGIGIEGAQNFRKKIFFYFLSIRVCAWPHRARCAQRDKKNFGHFFLKSRCAQRDYPGEKKNRAVHSAIKKNRDRSGERSAWVLREVPHEAPHAEQI